MSDPDKAAQDAAWQEIVANFGDRVELSEDDLAAESTAGHDFADDVDQPFEPDRDAYRDVYREDEAYDDADDDAFDEDGFVAPHPTIPRTSPDRLFAWAGVLGAPALAVVLFVLRATLGWWIPGWIVDLLVVAFLAGFGYLVLQMPREPRDPWDDGARL